MGRYPRERRDPEDQEYPIHGAHLSPIAALKHLDSARRAGPDIAVGPAGRRRSQGHLSDKGLRAMNGVFWVAIAVFSQAYGAAGRP